MGRRGLGIGLTGREVDLNSIIDLDRRIRVADTVSKISVYNLSPKLGPTADR